MRHHFKMHSLELEKLFIESFYTDNFIVSLQDEKEAED